MDHALPMPQSSVILQKPQPLAADEGPQEYDTYLDKNTGHQRLRGGALLIVDPNDIGAAQAPLHVELHCEQGVTKRMQTVKPALVHQVVRQELQLKGRIDIQHNGRPVGKAASFDDIGASDGSHIHVSVFTLGFPLNTVYTMHHPFKHGSCIPDEDHPDWFPPVAAHDTQHELSFSDLEAAWKAVAEGGVLAPTKEQQRMRQQADRVTKLQVVDKNNQVVPVELLDELIAAQHESHAAEIATTFASLLKM